MNGNMTLLLVWHHPQKLTCHDLLRLFVTSVMHGFQHMKMAFNMICLAVCTTSMAHANKSFIQS